MSITQNELKRILSNKFRLSFGNRGTFRILLFSDFHSHYKHQDPRTYEAFEKIIDDKNPDLVYLMGDLPGGPVKPAEAVEMLSALSRPMDKRGIPWTLVFGNHDDSICRGMPMDRIEKLMEKKCPNCMIKNYGKKIHGYSNHAIPVYRSESDDSISFILYGLDAGRDISAMNEDYELNGDIIEFLSAPKRLTARRRFDIVRFDQVIWYWELSKAVETMNGKTPALVMTHSGVQELRVLGDFPKNLDVDGELAEEIKVGAINSGLFMAGFQRGDVIGFYCGHNHVNTGEGKYCGIRFGYAGSIGYDAYGTKKPHSDRERNRLRGARMLTFDRDDIINYRSEYIYASDYVAPVIEVK